MIVETATDSPWSSEEVALFNPAFICLMIRQFVVGYHSYGGADPNVALAIVGTVLPLHLRTRNSLPATYRTDLAEWLARHSDVRFLHRQRVLALMPLIREALVFALQRDLLDFNNSELVLGRQGVTVSAIRAMGGDAGACLDSARKTGRWFAASGPVAYQLSLWGVTP